MYGLPADFNGKVLTGRTLEQICFNQNQIALHFDGDVTIVIESAFCHETDSSQSPPQKAPVPVPRSDLMELLGSSVTDASADKQSTLSLMFDNGHRLSIYDDSRQYESYKIQLPGKTIVV